MSGSPTPLPPVSMVVPRVGCDHSVLKLYGKHPTPIDKLYNKF